VCGLALLVRAVLDNGLDPLPRLVKGRWWRAFFPKEQYGTMYLLYAFEVEIVFETKTASKTSDWLSLWVEHKVSSE